MIAELLNHDESRRLRAVVLQTCSSSAADERRCVNRKLQSGEKGLLCSGVYLGVGTLDETKPCAGTLDEKGLCTGTLAETRLCTGTLGEKGLCAGTLDEKGLCAGVQWGIGADFFFFLGQRTNFLSPLPFSPLPLLSPSPPLLSL